MPTYQQEVIEVILEILIVLLHELRDLLILVSRPDVVIGSGRSSIWRRPQVPEEPA